MGNFIFCAVYGSSLIRLLTFFHWQLICFLTFNSSLDSRDVTFDGVSRIFLYGSTSSAKLHKM